MAEGQAMKEMANAQSNRVTRIPQWLLNFFSPQQRQRLSKVFGGGVDLGWSLTYARKQKLTISAPMYYAPTLQYNAQNGGLILDSCPTNLEFCVPHMRDSVLIDSFVL